MDCVPSRTRACSVAHVLLRIPLEEGQAKRLLGLVRRLGCLLSRTSLLESLSSAPLSRPCPPRALLSLEMGVVIPAPSVCILVCDPGGIVPPRLSLFTHSTTAPRLSNI